MHKRIIAPLIAFVLLIVFASFVIAQMPEKPWHKTITLPSGEVILDMSGEWDMMCEGYGPFCLRPLITEALTMKQEGSKFTAIKQIGSRWVPKGAEIIKGELDKDGFKTVYQYIHGSGTHGFVWEPCKWEISEHGNIVDLDCGERVRTTLTRR